MSREHILQRELAEVLAERWPSAPDVNRIAEESGLRLGEIGVYPRPIDHWSSAIAEAMDNQVVAQLIAAAELTDGQRKRFQSLTVPPSAARRATLRLAIEWDDQEGSQRTLPWRLESGGTRCPVTAQLRVFGGSRDLTPTLRWRRRRVLSRGTWEQASLTPTLLPQPGFSVWEATTDLQIGWLRAWRLECVAAVDDQSRRGDRMVIPRNGLRAAGGVFVAVLAFMTGWLWPVPGLQLSLGLSGGALLGALGILRASLSRDSARGPWWGLGMAERASLFALCAAVLLIALPPRVLVIVENRTKNHLPLGTHTKETTAIAPGRHTIPAWNSPIAANTSAICVCREAQDPSCQCHAESVRAIPVVHVQCRHQEWKGLAGLGAQATGDGILSIAGRVWLLPNDKCESNLDATATLPIAAVSPGASGTMTVRQPWTRDLVAVQITPEAMSHEVQIFGGSLEKPWITVRGLAGNEPIRLPAIDLSTGSVKLHFKSEEGIDSDLICSGILDAKGPPVEVRAFALPVSAKVDARGGVSSSWTGGSTDGRLCVRSGATESSITLSVRSLPIGAVFDLPTWLPRNHVEFVIGKERLASKCSGSRLSIVEVDPAVQGPVEVISGRRTWSIEPISIDKRRVAVICDPPEASTTVTVPREFAPNVRGRLPTLRLGPGSLAQVRPPPLPTPTPPVPSVAQICLVYKQDRTQVKRVRVCPRNCRSMPANQREALEINRRQRNTCSSVCMC